MKLEEGRKRDTAANALLALSFAASAAQSPKDLIRSGNIEGPGMQLMSRMMNKRKKATASGLDNPRVSEPARNRTFKEFLELCELIESSSGERMPRGSTGRRTGRALNKMSRAEKSTASIARKAGLKGTGKLSTKDLRTSARDYTNSDSDLGRLSIPATIARRYQRRMDGDGDGENSSGSTKQDHYIRTYSSARRAAEGERLINKTNQVGFFTQKVAPSSESVRKVKDLKTQMTKAGANKTGKVHNVDIMPSDSDHRKGDKEKQMERGRNFIQAIKDTPKQLKKAGAKPGDAVTGKPTAVMSGENPKTGAEKRAKLYGKIFGKRSTEKSEKTGLMVGKAD